MILVSTFQYPVSGNSGIKRWTDCRDLETRISVFPHVYLITSSTRVVYIPLVTITNGRLPHFYILNGQYIPLSFLLYVMLVGKRRDRIVRICSKYRVVTRCSLLVRMSTTVQNICLHRAVVSSLFV
ncbi:hypothetical protein GGS24DRAFT_451647 [Hypoxylon argillaceum]|nr:hypothetical protein GGS24DRAFT_451647 [Hypoxylon argillaceum]